MYMYSTIIGTCIHSVVYYTTFGGEHFVVETQIEEREKKEGSSERKERGREGE